MSTACQPNGERTRSEQMNLRCSFAASGAGCMCHNGGCIPVCTALPRFHPAMRQEIGLLVFQVPQAHEPCPAPVVVRLLESRCGACTCKQSRSMARCTCGHACLQPCMCCRDAAYKTLACNTEGVALQKLRQPAACWQFSLTHHDILGGVSRVQKRDGEVHAGRPDLLLVRRCQTV